MIPVITGKHKLRNNKIEKGCLKGRTSCHAETSSKMTFVLLFRQPFIYKIM